MGRMVNDKIIGSTQTLKHGICSVFCGIDFELKQHHSLQKLIQANVVGYSLRYQQVFKFINRGGAFVRKDL